MKLYSYYRSSCSYRVRIALALKGVAYEYIPVNLAPGVHGQDEPAFAAVNPLKQVPVLVFEHQGVEHQLTQSLAILSYLDQRFPTPQLLPEDLWLRSKVLEAVEIVNAGIQPLQNVSVQALLQKHAGSDVNRSFRDTTIVAGLKRVEELANAQPGPYFAGVELSMADLFIVPQLYNAERFRIDLSIFPRLQALRAATGELPAFRAAAPENQPDTPPSAKG